MKILLHDARLGLFYQEPSTWTREREKALDFRQSAAAAKLAAELRLQRAEVVLSYGDRAPDVFVPLDTPK